MRSKMDVLCSDGIQPHAFCRILSADRRTADTDELVKKMKPVAERRAAICCAALSSETETGRESYPVQPLSAAFIHAY